MMKAEPPVRLPVMMMALDVSSAYVDEVGVTRSVTGDDDDA